MSSPEEFPKTFETAAIPPTFGSNWAARFVWMMALIVIGFFCFEAYRSRPVQAQQKDLVKKANPQHSGVQSNQSRPSVVFSIIWEGQSLRESNIAALRGLREKHPRLNFYHFMSPGYFARNHQKLSEISNLVRNVIRSSDFVGLHLNGWRSVIERAGVEFKYGENFWGVQLDEHNCFSDCGNDLPLSGYSKGEMLRIVRTSLELLEQAGFRNIDSMMAGGWLADEALIEAATRQQIKYGYSRVWPSLLKSSIGSFPLMTWVESIWKGVSEENFAMVTQRHTRHGSMTELGNSAAAVDFLDADHALALFNRIMDQPASKHPRVFHIGLHQETALRYVSRFDQVITRVGEELRRRGMSSEVSPRDSIYEATKLHRLSH